MKRDVLARRCAELRARLTGEPEAAGEIVPDPSELPRFMERHYSIKELADLWHLSHDTVRRIFMNEPGVVDFSGTATKRDKRKRRHRSLLIPESVVIRVYNRRRLPGQGGE